VGGNLNNQRDINRRVEQFKKAGERETLKPPQIISMGGGGAKGKATTISWARCKTEAGEGQTIQADLLDDKGDIVNEISVLCIIPGTGNLNEAIPYLMEATDMPVVQRTLFTENGYETLWFCLWPFQAFPLCPETNEEEG
jgi:hypothetical protein